MPAGRPLKYETPEQMEEVIEMYFDACRENYKNTLAENYQDIGEDLCTDDIHPTISGMALVLDLTRQSLINYEGRPEFLATIKKGKARVESYVEQRLYGNNVTGLIFNLKNNFEWKDQKHNALSGPDGGPIQTEDVNAVDALRRYLSTKSS